MRRASADTVIDIEVLGGAPERFPLCCYGRVCGIEDGESVPLTIPLFPVCRKRAQCFQEEKNGCGFQCAQEPALM
ncbi:hypothetical protein NDU88_008155 [Pleurodeles waltl]|uniref:Uncharacterized protein n=1 Tax=Pleurodeles waltl TaxID=8319 RepID=A0AAV7NYI2_PLEWA|nr:hypothetical protein NDU88_008155 [Pleurodeles waltl]